MLFVTYCVVFGINTYGYFYFIERNKSVFFSHCVKKLNEQAAELFESGEDREVNNGLIIMNEFIVPFLPLLLMDEMEEKDILAVEDMRNRWCSYLGQEMECKFKVLVPTLVVEIKCRIGYYLSYNIHIITSYF